MARPSSLELLRVRQAGCDWRRLALAASVRGAQQCAAGGRSWRATVRVHELQVRQLLHRSLGDASCMGFYWTGPLHGCAVLLASIQVPAEFRSLPMQTSALFVHMSKAATGLHQHAVTARPREHLPPGTL